MNRRPPDVGSSGTSVGPAARPRAGRGRSLEPHDCPLCGHRHRLFRVCRHCGFEMCQDCTDENLWGITCNHITWQCPDCGEASSF